MCVTQNYTGTFTLKSQPKVQMLTWVVQCVNASKIPQIKCNNLTFNQSFVYKLCVTLI